MPSYILGFTIAFMLTFLIIPLIIQFTNVKSLYDKPNGRKVHKFPTPTLGGIAIFAGFFIALTLTFNLQQLSEVKFIIYASAFMVITGVIDDILSITFIKKALTQLISTLLIVYWDGIRITDAYGLFGLHTLDPVTSIIVTMLVVFTIINAVNFIDGIDGNASMHGIFILACFGIWFHLTGNQTYALLAMITIGAFAAFLRYNYSPAKIFMGDTGSLFMGLVISVLSIKFLQMNKFVVGTFHVPAAPSVLLGLLIVPVFDIFRLIIVRLKNGKSPFNADQNHIHHNMLILGFGHNQASFILLSITVFFTLISVVFKNFNTNLLFAIHAVASVLMLAFMTYRLKKREDSLLKIFNLSNFKFNLQKQKQNN